MTYGVGTLTPHLNGWVQRFMFWVQQTFPHPGHKLLNFVRPLSAGRPIRCHCGGRVPHVGWR